MKKLNFKSKRVIDGHRVVIDDYKTEIKKDENGYYLEVQKNSEKHTSFVFFKGRLHGYCKTYQGVWKQQIKLFNNFSIN